MSDDLGHACAELAALIPALVPALSRDSIPPGGRAGLSAGRAVNPDVLHAMTVLAAEIPAACAAACEVAGEPWQHRPPAICLRAIPRLYHRLTALGMPAAATDLETGVHHWTRLVKLALRLRSPDLPPAGTKPLITGGPPRGCMPSAGEPGIVDALADSPASIDALAAGNGPGRWPAGCGARGVQSAPPPVLPAGA